MEKHLQTSELNYLKRLLEEREKELRKSRIVYLKPWPEEEATVARIKKHLEMEIYLRNGERR